MPGCLFGLSQSKWHWLRGVMAIFSTLRTSLCDCCCVWVCEGSANSRAFGPLGANLFIFHLPSSWTDTDLKQHFNCFGNVVSAHIRTDGTGRNSGKEGNYGMVPLRVVGTVLSKVMGSRAATF